MALGSFFQKYFRSVKFKGLPARNDASNLPRLTTLKKNYHIFRTFYQCKLLTAFISDRASFLDSFSSIGQVAFTSPLLCPSILVFFSIFKLIIVFIMLNENFFATCKVKRWRKMEIFAVSFSSLLSLLSLNACTQMYLRAKGVQARMQVGCHWILSFVLLLPNSSSSSSIRINRLFYMFPFL